MRKQNKGELSESITKLSILANKVLCLITSDDASPHPFTVRSIRLANKNYLLMGKSIYEQVYTPGDIKPSNRFVCFSEEIQKRLPSINKKLKAGKGTFSIDEVEYLEDKFGLDTTSDVTHSKGDIKLTFLENGTGKVLPEESVSLKSFVGNNPTVLNASANSTKITFKISGISQDKLEELSSKNYKARPNMNALLEMDAKFSEINFSSALESNLKDFNAKEELVFAIVTHFTKKDKEASKMNYLEGLIEGKEKKEIFNQSIKTILRAAVIGMNPSELWDGVARVADNLVLTMPNGTCKAFMGRKTLESYLYKSCYIDTPSQTKHKYGKIYQVNNEWFIDLNFQIRLSNAAFTN